ncbi:AHA1 Hsp90 co-chaperone AHA1 [Candida maltosa Xu316]
MVVNNPNNWHWVDKNCLPWSVEYFKKNLHGIEAREGDTFVHIHEVSSVEGDVDVSQRKGKVISLFDVRIVLTFHGYTGKDDNVSGSITIPELTYDSESDDLQFEITIYNETADNTGITGLIKQKLIPQLRELLMKFGPDLIEINNKVTSTFTKANQAPVVAKKETPQPEKPVEVEKPTKVEQPIQVEALVVEKKVTPTPTRKLATDKISDSKNHVYGSDSSVVPKYNTTTLHMEPSFNTSADQIYMTLLDEARIAAWTRSYPIIEKFPPKEGSSFKFFGGSVSGKFLKLVPNEQIVELWRLDDWKEGHYAQLDMKLVQSSGETKLVVKFSGIPIGEEERVKNNFEERYIRSIKITFGFGAVL